LFGIALCLAVVGLTFGQGVAGREHFLDLTAGDVTFTAPAVGRGSGVGYEGQKPITAPLRLELQQLDESIFVFATSFIYEVAVSNTGSTSLGFPWSVDRAAIEDRGWPSVQCSVYLIAIDGIGREHIFGAVILDGSSDVSGSIEVLAPHESARIRIKGSIVMDQDAAKRLASEAGSRIKAVLTVQTDPLVQWERVVSTNTLRAVFRLASHL
jgi:hypothetical protein